MLQPVLLGSGVTPCGGEGLGAGGREGAAYFDSASGLKIWRGGPVSREDARAGTELLGRSRRALERIAEGADEGVYLVYERYAACREKEARGL